MILSPDRLHAAQISHTPGSSVTPISASDHHDALQPLPILHNFELLNSERKGDPVSSSPALPAAATTGSFLLLDDRLRPTSSQEPPQEQEHVLTLPPAKQRAPPPPSLTLRIPEHPHEGSEWHIASRSPESSDNTPATQIPSEYSGVGAGYFSPLQSPDASPTTPVPASRSSSIPFVKKGRLRARSVANGDLAVGKNRIGQKMVKERRSLQSLLMTSFLHPLQPQSTTPLGVVPEPDGAETRSSCSSTQGGSSSEIGNSEASSGAGNGARRETRRSLYGRRRSQTYSGRDNNITSPSLVSTVTRMPPMPERYSPPPAGRESPSSYLLDDDPFALFPSVVAPPVNSPFQSPGFTPIHSPTHSIIHSPSTVSLSSADSSSMPGTPVFHSFGLVTTEEREDPLPSPLPLQSGITPQPPPTPSSPLNPRSASSTTLNERAKSKERMLRSLSTTLSTTFHSSAPSPHPASPPLSYVPSVPQPPPTRARPAHTRPAFAPRPSLPSLSTLSRMGAAAGGLASSLRGKKRRGKVGAGLPAEPWDMPTTEEQTSEKLEDDESVQESAVVEEQGEGSLEKLGETESEQTETEALSTSRTSDPSSSAEVADHVDVDCVPVEESNKVPASELDLTVELLPSSASDLVPEDPQNTAAPVNVQTADGVTDASGVGNLISGKTEARLSESGLVSGGEREGVSGKVEDGKAHGEGGIDGEHAYMTMSSTLSETILDANGESVGESRMVTTYSENMPLSEAGKESEEAQEARAERSTDQDVDQLAEDDSSFNVGPLGDECDDGDALHRLADPDAEWGPLIARVGSCAIAIPGRASAIPRHVLRALTPYPFFAPRCESPSSSNASWSPQSSLEDFGVLLSSSPAFRGDQRPDSLTIDPGLPEASVSSYTSGEESPSGEDHSKSKDGRSSSSPSSSSPPQLSSQLSSSDPCNPIIEAVAETGADIDLRSTNDFAFTPEAEVPAESFAPNYATSSPSSLPSQESSSCSSPIVSHSELGFPDRSPSRSPIRENDYSIEYTSFSGHRSFSPHHVEDCAGHYLDDYEHEGEHERQYEYAAEDEDDSSMLPPLSTLPEEDPVFALSPSRSRERYEPIDYAPASSRSISRKASAATMASIFSMRSGSSGYTSQISHSFSRNHSPAASLSTTLPFSNSHNGSFVARHAHDSSFGSVDSGLGHGPSPSSVSSLHSKSSVDLRSLASARRHGSQSSGMSMLSHSSTRTKFEPHNELHVPKKASAEDVSLGLRAYPGNSYAAAVQAELEGKASKYKNSSAARYNDDELDLDLKHGDVAPAVEAVISGWTSKAAGLDAFEPGSSAGTLRPSIEQPESVRLGSRSPSVGNGHQDGSDMIPTRGHANGYSYSSSRGGAGKDWGGAGDYAGGYGNGYYGQGNGGFGGDDGGNHGGPLGSGRRGNDRDDDGDKPSRRPSAYSPSESSSESESESESDSDLYGEQSPGGAHTQVSPIHAPSLTGRRTPSQTQEEPEAPIFTQLRKGRKGIYRPPTNSIADESNRGGPPATEDDDVPLAQRIPGALQAQKSIRQQVKSERERRRRERPAAPSARTSRAPEGTISPPPQHMPGSNQGDRGRTLTARLPRTAPLSAAALSSSQEAAMIAQRMMQPHHATRAVHRQRAKTLSSADGVPPDVLAQRLLKVQARGQDSQLPLQQRVSAASSVHSHTPAYASVNADSPVDHSSGVSTTARRRPSPPTSGSYHIQQHASDAPAPVRTLRPMRSFHGASRESASAGPAPPVPVAPVRRRSPSRARPAPAPAPEPDAGLGGLARNRSVKSARTSADKTGRRSEEEAHMLSAHHSHAQGHPVPPVPALSRGPSPPPPGTRHAVTQTRIFINDMQHFNVVETGLDTSAKDVLDMLRHQGDLRGEERSPSSWTLYEMYQDFGMERPVRKFELVADISGSWNKEKTANCFMVKPSRFAHHLATIPSSIPKRSGFVEYESKKGKWSKRWLELREHGLWLSKREGKDDEFLCSLSAFDAYIVTRIHKAPRGFTFAVKSTDPMALFENKADYMHVFSVPEETGLAWVESIWLARSYILYQEKNVLFRNKSDGAGANLARAETRKKPAQTYVALEQTGTFEPGSLLAKRAAVV